MPFEKRCSSFLNLNRVLRQVDKPSNRPRQTNEIPTQLQDLNFIRWSGWQSYKIKTCLGVGRHMQSPDHDILCNRIKRISLVSWVGFASLPKAHRNRPAFDANEYNTMAYDYTIYNIAITSCKEKRGHNLSFLAYVVPYRPKLWLVDSWLAQLFDNSTIM